MSKEKRKALSDRELLELFHDRLDAIETDMTLTMQWCRQIALSKERPDIASEVDQRMAIRRVASQHDEPFPLSEEDTNPGHG